MMMKKIKTAVISFSLICSFSVLAAAEQREDSAESMRVQEEEPIPFDQWYSPDDTLDRVDDDAPENVILPETPDTDERVAPEKDPRPQAR